MSEEILFTPAALLDLLSKIEELKDYEISVYEDLSDNIIVSLDGNQYILDCDNATNIDVEPEIVATISDINEEAYEELIENEEFNNVDPLQPTDEVEGGILKELATTLLVGGVVRMGGAAVKDFMRK